MEPINPPSLSDTKKLSVNIGVVTEEVVFAKAVLIPEVLVWLFVDLVMCGRTDDVQARTVPAQTQPKDTFERK